MSDPHDIWQLGQWIGRQEGGAARLAWADGEHCMVCDEVCPINAIEVTGATRRAGGRYLVSFKPAHQGQRSL